MILSKNQIYLLDDEEGVRRTLQIILSSEGYDVQTFANGTDLVKHLQQMAYAAPAVALIDLRLPDMSGVTAMQKVKERSPETEVIMLTGNPDVTSAIESIKAGAYAYILKPYNIDELKSNLAKILEKQRLLRENREMTEELKQWNEKLEEAVYRRTLALEESYKKLQSLYEMRTQFITIMSHELRTPATALMGFADTLRDRWKELPKDKIQEYLNIISLESDRMVLLMSEIFEVSRIQEGKLSLELERVDILAFLDKIVNEFQARFPSHAFGFIQKDKNASVMVDPLYFKTALSYILMNAVKYSPDGGQVNVLARLQDDKFEVRVEDNGPGVPTDLREKIFEPFFRSMDDVNRRTPGAGLGLTIARGIFAGMNATVRIEDKITGGKSGCAAVVTLPCVRGMEKPAAPDL